jgi:hypothetical protein
MTGNLDKLRGELRFFGHFVLYAAVPQGVAYIGQAIGLGPGFFMLAPLLLIPAGVAVIFIVEERDLQCKRNGVQKGILDLISKGTGWTVGMMTWLGWWA